MSLLEVGKPASHGIKWKIMLKIHLQLFNKMKKLCLWTIFSQVIPEENTVLTYRDFSEANPKALWFSVKWL